MVKRGRVVGSLLSKVAKVGLVNWFSAWKKGQGLLKSTTTESQIEIRRGESRYDRGYRLSSLSIMKHLVRGPKSTWLNSQQTADVTLQAAKTQDLQQP